MPVSESLTAILGGRDKLSGKLDEIADSALDVAEGMNEAAASAEALETGLDDVEDQAPETARAVDKVTRSVNDATEAFTAGIPAAMAYQGALESIEDVNIDAGLSATETPHTAADGAAVTEVRASVNEASFLAARSAIESLPDTHEVEVRADTDSFDLTGLRASVADIGDMSMPTPSMDEFSEDAEDATEETHTFRSALSALPGLLSTIARIDWGELLLPDRDGRDGSWDISLPDVGGLEWPDRPPPEVGIPVGFRPGSIDLRNHIPDRIASGDGDGIDLAWSLPDLPDLTGVAKGIGKVGDAASDAVGPVTDFFAGLAKMAGLGKVVSGLSKVAGAIGSVGSAASGLAGIGGVALLGFSLGGIVSVVAAIGGLVTAVIGLGTALAGLLGVGLFAKGEQLAESSQDIENAMEGVEAYVKSLKDEVREALAPIFELEGLQGFLEGFIRGGLSAIEDYATMTARLFEPIRGMFDRLGEVWSAEQPEFFAELEETIRAFLPMIEGFLAWFLRASPDALSYMREMGTELIPKVVRMFSAMSGAIKPFLPGGDALMSILFDLVTIFVELVTPIAELLGLLSALLELLAGGIDKAADAVKWLSDGLSGLIDDVMSVVRKLDAFTLGDLLYNITVGALEKMANATLKALESAVNVVLDWIKQRPGGNEALEKVGLEEGVEFGEADYSHMMEDLNPEKEGKQTTFSEIPGDGTGGSGTQPYQGGDVYINEVAVGETDSELSEPELRRLVTEAFRDAQQQGRRRTTQRH